MNNRFRVISSGLLFLVASAGASQAAMAACQTGVQNFDYPAQRLDTALQQFAHTTGCFVKVETSALGDAKAPALDGQFTPAAALVQLVRGSGFEAHMDDGQYRVDQTDRRWIDQHVEQAIAAVQKAKKAGTLDADTAKKRLHHLKAIRKEARGLIRHQGFLSAAERASYERVFNETGPQDDSSNG